MQVFLGWSPLSSIIYLQRKMRLQWCVLGAMPLCFPAPLPAAADMQPNPWGFFLAQGPAPKLLCAGWAPEPLARVSVQCWSLDENLSCSTQHNVPIIAPIQGNDTCLLVHPGPRKADRDLSGGCWEKESFMAGWKPLLLLHLQVLVPRHQAPTCTQATGSPSAVTEPGALLCLEEKELLFLCPNAAHPFPSGPSSRKEHSWLLKWGSQAEVPTGPVRGGLCVSQPPGKAEHSCSSWKARSQQLGEVWPGGTWAWSGQIFRLFRRTRESRFQLLILKCW